MRQFHRGEPTLIIRLKPPDPFVEDRMDDQTKPDWLDLESCIPLESSKGERNAEGITGLSRETLERRYSHLIRKPSPRRRTMKLRDALAIANGGLAESQ
jgi:hypothetical protein